MRDLRRSPGWRRLSLFSVVLFVAVALPATRAEANDPYAVAALGVSASGYRTMVVSTSSVGLTETDWNLTGPGPIGWQNGPAGCYTTTTAAPAMVANAQYAFLLARGSNGTVCLNQGSPTVTSQSGTIWSYDPAAYYTWHWIGWQSLGVTTNVAPVAATCGNRTIALVTAPDGRILYDWWDLGGGGHGFRELPGGGRSATTAAASLVGPDCNYLFVVVRGLDGQLYLNQGQLDSGLVGWQALGVYSNVAAAMTGSGSRTALVITKPNGTVWYDWWDLGGGGHGFQLVPNNSGGPITYDAPGAGLVYSYFLTVVVRGTDGYTYRSTGQIGGPLDWWKYL